MCLVIFCCALLIVFYLLPPPQSLSYCQKWQLRSTGNDIWLQRKYDFFFISPDSLFIKIAFIVSSNHWCFEDVSHNFPKYFDNIQQKSWTLEQLACFIPHNPTALWMVPQWWGNQGSEWKSPSPKSEKPVPSELPAFISMLAGKWCQQAPANMPQVHAWFLTTCW